MTTNSKKTIAAILATGLIATLALWGVSAYKWDPSVQWPDYSSERHDSMTAAFETSDYDAWLALMDGKGKVTQVVTEENFSTFVEAHNLAKAGDIEGSKALRTELGLWLKNGSGKGNWKGLNKGSSKGSWKGSGNCNWGWMNR